MGSELLAARSMEAREKAVLQGLSRSGNIGADRGRESDMDWGDAIEEAGLAAGGVVDVQYSRVWPAGGGVAEDPAARGGDDGDLQQLQHQVPLCILRSDGEPSRKMRQVWFGKNHAERH